jgi:enoyl-CoA hydratase
MSASGQRHVRVESADDTRVVTIDRPPANALDGALLDEGLRVAAALHEELPRAVVLTATGAFFSGGLDLNFVRDVDPAGHGALVERINKLFLAWYTLPCPVVCAVNGHAVAGGLVLALCADVRLAVPNAMYGLTEVAVGVPFPAAAIGVVAGELASHAARRLVLGGQLADGDTMLSLGVFDELSPPAALAARATETAARLGAHSPHAFRLAKAALRGATSARIRESIRTGADPTMSDWLAR